MGGAIFYSNAEVGLNSKKCLKRGIFHILDANGRAFALLATLLVCDMVLALSSKKN